MITFHLVLIVALACVTIEAFFSGSEIALVSASRVRLRAKVKEGNRGAALAEKYLDSPQLILATTLLGTNLATVIFAVTVTVFIVQNDFAGGEFLTVLTVTPFTLLFGEVIPKTFFQQRADDLVTRIIFPLHAVSLLLRPLILVVSGFAGVISRFFDVDLQRALVTRQELSLLLEASKASGGEETEISETEREMISNLLELSGATVGNLMLPLSEVTAISQDTSVLDAVREVADKQHSRMPVFEGRVDNIIGVLHVFDLLRVSAHERDSPIQPLVRPVRYAPESVLAVDLLRDLQGSGTPMAIIVDEYGGAVGVVTIEDLLEEIVGDIVDEHDDVSELIVAERPGVWTIKAKASVERVNEELSLELPLGDEYESIAGLILVEMRRLPEVGESVMIGEITLRVSQATNRAIDEIQLLRRRKR